MTHDVCSPGCSPSNEAHMNNSINPRDKFGEILRDLVKLLTFLPLHLWPPAGGRHSAGELLEVDVAVLVLVQRGEERVHEGGREGRRHQGSHDVPESFNVNKVVCKKIQLFVQGDPSGHRLHFVDFVLVVPMSALFCLGRCKSDRIGRM